MEIKSLPIWAKKFLQPDSAAVVELETGHRNSDGQRTQLGIHQFINFILTDEETAAKFAAHLKDKRDVAKAKAKAAKAALKAGESVDEDED